MPLWVAAILGGLIQSAGTLVGRVLLSLGFGYVAYTGIDTGLSFMRDQALAGFAGLPADVVGILSAGKLGTVVSIITSAMLARMALNGLTGGTLRKLVIKS